MRYREFGRTGIKVSVVGLGAWQAGFKSWGKDYTKEDVIGAYLKAFELGINFIDTAETYGAGVSEAVVGEALKRSKRRDQIVVATKVAGYNATPSRVEKAARSSLRRLGLDVIDLYQVHWPPSIYTSLGKLFEQMEKLVDKGIIRHIGVSNFSRKVLSKSMELMHKYEIVSNQVQYSLLYRAVENDLMKFMRDNKIELIAWSPLAKGALAGKLKPDSLAKKFDYTFKRGKMATELFKVMRELSEKHNANMTQIALAWLISKGAYPIPGVKRIEHVIDNANAANIFLEPQDIVRLDEASKIFTSGNIDSVISRLLPNFIQRTIINMMGGV